MQYACFLEIARYNSAHSHKTTMNKQHAITLLGGSTLEAAKAIGISRSAVGQWPEVLTGIHLDRVQAALWRKLEAQDKMRVYVCGAITPVCHAATRLAALGMTPVSAHYMQSPGPKDVARAVLGCHAIMYLPGDHKLERAIADAVGMQEVLLP